jgi:hypothetical protein
MLVDGKVFAEAWVMAYICAYTERLSKWTGWHRLDDFEKLCWIYGCFFFYVASTEEADFG